MRTVAVVPFRVEPGRSTGLALIGSRHFEGWERWTPNGWVRELGASRVYLRHAERVRYAKDEAFAREVAKAEHCRA